MSSLARFATLAATFAVLAPSPVLAAASAYVYLAYGPQPAAGYAIARYPVVGGHAGAADLSIANGATGFSSNITVAGNGTVYLITCNDTACGSSVDAFAQGAAHPERALQMPSAGTLATATAIDAQGHLFVAYRSGSKSGVYAYAPNAREKATPLADIPLTAPAFALAIDAGGDLEAAAGTQLEVFTAPAGAPRLERRLALPTSTPANHGSGLALGGDGSLYLTAFLRASSAAIFAYAPNSSGFVSPLRAFVPYWITQGGPFVNTYYNGGAFAFDGPTLLVPLTGKLNLRAFRTTIVPFDPTQPGQSVFTTFIARDDYVAGLAVHPL